jgi:REP-associated tyrosine transposase
MQEPIHAPHSQNLRVNRQMEGPGTFFVTKCLHPRKAVISDAIASEICSAFCFYTGEQKIYLGAFVVMLDHWHLLMATANGKTISTQMRDLGRWIGRGTQGDLAGQGCVWQSGFYETRIRSAKQFQHVLVYVEENPVRAGLVSRPSDWKWSSAHLSNRRIVTKPWPWGFEKA